MSSSNKRLPPAYQEYASDMLANAQYRMMSLPEKGLLDLLRRECWVNHQVPLQSAEMAAYLGIAPIEIEKNLTTKVLSFFIERHQSLICPELEKYRAILIERQKKIVNGGRNGGRSTQAKNKSNQATLEGNIKPLSREEMKGEEINRGEKQSLGEGLSNEEMAAWIDDYDSSPDASAGYLTASRGH